MSTHALPKLLSLLKLPDEELKRRQAEQLAKWTERAAGAGIDTAALFDGEEFGKFKESLNEDPDRLRLECERLRAAVAKW